MAAVLLDPPLQAVGLWPKMRALADCLCAFFTEEGRGNLCSCGPMPGLEVSLDNVGCSPTNYCGKAWVRLAIAQPTTGLGVVSDTINNCGAELGFQLEVGCVRCIVAASDNFADAPTDAQYAAATEVQMLDLLTMRRAILCCNIGDVILDTYTPIGPAGMAVGGYWLATLGET